MIAYVVQCSYDWEGSAVHDVAADATTARMIGEAHLPDWEADTVGHWDTLPDGSESLDLGGKSIDILPIRVVS